MMKVQVLGEMEENPAQNNGNTGDASEGKVVGKLKDIGAAHDNQSGRGDQRVFQKPCSRALSVFSITILLCIPKYFIKILYSI